MSTVTKVLLFELLIATLCVARVTEKERAQIDEITGAKGSYTAEEDVYRVAFPRSDLKVTADRQPMHPFMGLTSWAAFTSMSAGQVMVMGDLTLAEDEVNPVMSVALDNGLEVTALHNHFFYDNPRVMFMHIGGRGSVERIAGAVRKAVDKVREIRTTAPVPASSFGGSQAPEKSSITPGPIEAILGVKGQANSGMYKIAIGRKAKAHGHEVGNQMGVNTWAAFAGSDDSAFVDGDFAMLVPEVQAVLKSLRGSGINIVAIHNHMTHEQPQYVFLHYWGKGKAADLARAVKSALDTQR
ncbi:MAG: DUF1259 domain-containing protein [Bryobacteraceae bacterium]